MTQMNWTDTDDPDVVIVGDRAGAAEGWFDTQPIPFYSSARSLHRRSLQSPSERAN